MMQNNRIYGLTTTWWRVGGFFERRSPANDTWTDRIAIWIMFSDSHVQRAIVVMHIDFFVFFVLLHGNRFRLLVGINWVCSRVSLVDGTFIRLRRWCLILYGILLLLMFELWETLFRWKLGQLQSGFTCNRKLLKISMQNNLATTTHLRALGHSMQRAKAPPCSPWSKTLMFTSFFFILLLFLFRD